MEWHLMIVLNVAIICLTFHFVSGQEVGKSVEDNLVLIIMNCRRLPSN